MEQFELDEDADSEVFALCGGVSSTRSKAGSQRGSTDNERDSASSASGESSQEAVLSQSVNTAAPPPPQPSVADFARALEQQQLPPVPPQQLPQQQPQLQSAASFELSAPAVPAAEQAAPPSSHPLPGEKRQRVERVATARPEAATSDATRDHIVTITVPPGVQPGQTFQMQLKGLVLRMTCPPDAAAGQALRVRVPTPPPSSRSGAASSTDDGLPGARKVPQDQPKVNLQSCVICHQGKRRCDKHEKGPGEPCTLCARRVVPCVPHVAAKGGRPKKQG